MLASVLFMSPCGSALGYLFASLYMLSLCGSALGYLLASLPHPALLGPRQCQHQCLLLSGCSSYTLLTTIECYLHPAAPNVSGGYRFSLTKAFNSTARCQKSYWFVKTKRSFICIPGLLGARDEVKDTIMAAVPSDNSTVVFLFSVSSGFVYTYKPLTGLDIQLTVFHQQSRSVIFATEDKLFHHSISSGRSTFLKRVRCNALAVSGDGKVFFAMKRNIYIMAMLIDRIDNYPAFGNKYLPSFLSVTKKGNVVLGCSKRIELKTAYGTLLNTLFNQYSIAMCHDGHDSLFLITVKNMKSDLIRVNVSSGDKTLFYEGTSATQLFVFNKRLYVKYAQPSKPSFWSVKISFKREFPPIVDVNFSTSDVKPNRTWKTACYIL